MTTAEKPVIAPVAQVPSPRSNGHARRTAAPPTWLTPAERATRGKSARQTVPHESHGEFSPGTGRPDPVALLESQGTTRLSELLPIRYGRMLVSPFTFYRGAALVMAHDLAGTPVSGITAQLCGDAHLSNFGLFASPERRMVFDINDFDETCPGPWEWDVKRLVASFAVAGRDIGLSTKKRRVVNRAVAGRYREAMERFAVMSDLDVWYAHGDIADIQEEYAQQLKAVNRKKLAKTLDKARTRDSMQALRKLTRVVDGQRRIVSDPPVVVTITDLLPDDIMRRDIEGELRHLIRSYSRTLQSDRRRLIERYRPVDFARKIVGVGSVGTRCWILLMLGRDDADPLFLQAKEASASVLTSVGCKSGYSNEGHRVVAGQRLMQASSDIFLGWQRVDGLDGNTRDFYLRQLRDWKGSAEIETMEPVGLARYGELCAWSLARAHARSGDRIAISSYLGGESTFDEALADFAENYADQNERDHAALKAEVDAGRLTAEFGV